MITKDDDHLNIQHKMFMEIDDGDELLFMDDSNEHLNLVYYIISCP